MKLHTAMTLSVALLMVSLQFILNSCQKQELPKPSKQVVTLANLQTAYAKAIKYKTMYSLFVKQAEKERNKIAAKLYRALAHSEEIRATNHAALLRESGVEPVTPPQETIPVGTTAQTLRMAMSSEDIQHDNMSPDMMRTALLEKDSVAAEQFRQSKEVDARHRQLLFEVLNALGKIAKVDFVLCSRCGYVFTSDATGDCPVCNPKEEAAVSS